MLLSMHSNVYLLQLASLLVCSRADYRLEVLAHSFSNPNGRCAKYDGGCCDIHQIHGQDCTGYSDPYFIFCLRSARKADHDSSNCPLGRAASPIDGRGMAVANISFTVGSTKLLGLPNPLMFDVAGRWPQEVQLLLDVIDHDVDTPFVNEDDLVDTIIIEISTAANGNLSNWNTYIGQSGYASIDLTYNVSCAENFYSNDCDIQCVENDNDQRHRTCSTEGEIVCWTNFQSPLHNSYCTECVFAEQCSPSHSLTRIAIAGITVGALAVIIILVLVLLLIFKLLLNRKRRGHTQCSDRNRNEMTVVIGVKNAPSEHIETDGNTAYQTVDTHNIMSSEHIETGGNIAYQTVDSALQPKADKPVDSLADHLYDYCA